MSRARPVKVSIIIPVYNGERFIQGAIESVLCQTVQDFELIVVDDGSTDRSKEIVLKIPAPVIYVHQQNAGTAAARNRGVLATQGEYIAFLDQDDQWYPGKLAAQIRQLDDNPQFGVVYSDIDIIDEQSRIIDTGHLKNWRDMPEQGPFLGIFPEFPRPDVYPSAALMRRESFLRAGMFDPAFKRNNFEDVDLWFRMVKQKVGEFYFHPESLVQIRRHPFQGGHNRDAWEENWLLCADKLLQLYRDDPRRFQLRRKVARIYSKKAKNVKRAGDRAQAKTYFKKAFRCNPYDLKTLERLLRLYTRKS